MKWIKRLLIGNSKSFQSDDKLSDFSVDEEGNISATVTLSINGEKLGFPIDANEQKLVEEAKAKVANKANPNSCEREPAEDWYINHIVCKTCGVELAEDAVFFPK